MRNRDNFIQYRLSIIEQKADDFPALVNTVLKEIETILVNRIADNPILEIHKFNYTKDNLRYIFPELETKLTDLGYEIKYMSGDTIEITLNLAEPNV